MSEKIKETYWSRFPSTYDEKMEYVVGQELRDEIIQELGRLPELGNLVELGCGTGVFSEAIMTKADKLIATDLSDTLLEVARTRLGNHPKVTLQIEDGMATSFRSETIDSVFMSNLIHVIENPTSLLQECRRILRENGTLVIVTFTGFEMKFWEKIKMGVRFLKAWGKPPAHTHSFTPENLTKLMENNGFSVEVSKVLGKKTRSLFMTGKKNTSNT